MMDFIANNWMGIVLATIAAMVIGSLWYSNLLFGKEWQKLVKLKNSDMKKGRTPAMVAMLLMALLSAYVLKRFIVIAQPADVLEALKLALWIWLGFIVTYVVGGGFFEKRPPKLMAINLANQLITLLVMAAILFRIN